jgi:hypothetical protein
VKGDRIRFLDGEYPVVGALYDRHGSVHWGGGGNPADHIKGTFITNFGRQGTAPNSGSQYDTPCGECFPLTGHMINILQITWKYPSLDGAGQPTYPAATLEMLGYFKKQFPLMNELRRLELLRGEADVNKEKLATLEKQRAAFADEQKEGQLRLQRFVSLEKTLREKLSAAARKLDEAANSIVDGVDTGCAETAKTLAKAAKEVIKETGL